MDKTKVASLFLATLILSAGAIADNAADTADDGVDVQCSAPDLSVPASLEEANRSTAPTTSIDTFNRVVLGFANQGENKIGNKILGTVGPKGHVTNFPLWFVDDNGNIASVDKICFSSNHDPNKNEVVYNGGFWEIKKVLKAGHIGMSAPGVYCHNGCSGTTYHFGTGSYG